MALAEATLHNSRRALSTRAGQDGRVIPPLVSSLVPQGCSGKFSKNGDREDNVFVERKPRIEVRLRTFDAHPERGDHPHPWCLRDFHRSLAGTLPHSALLGENP